MNSVIIGVSGASASGKTLLCDVILQSVGAAASVAMLREDNYYRDLSHKPLQERKQVNYDHPSAFDHNLLIQHLCALKEGKSICAPQYDYTIHNRKQQTTQVPSCKIVLLEGILVLAVAALRQQLDIKIFVDTPAEICLLRRIRRDVSQRQRTLEEVLQQYENYTRPGFLQFIEPAKQYADLIVPHGGKNSVAVDLIQTKMERLLHASF